jgi:hypothetical protein
LYIRLILIIVLQQLKKQLPNFTFTFMVTLFNKWWKRIRLNTSDAKSFILEQPNGEAVFNLKTAGSTMAIFIELIKQSALEHTRQLVD